MEQSEEQQSREALWRTNVRIFSFLLVVSSLILLFGTIVFSLLIIGWPENLQLGPNSSMLIGSYPLFIESITVEEIDDANNRPMVYGFYEYPPLDVFTTFSEAYETSLLPNSIKEWTYYLNFGSQINISYSVNSSSSYSLVLFVLAGSGLVPLYEKDPFDVPPRTFIHGNGTISQDIRVSSSYFVAVVNTNSEIVQVRLDIKVEAALFNTTGAYYECNLRQKECSMRLFLRRENAALLTTPPQKPGTANGKWSIKISYGRRRITYLFGVGGMIFLLCLCHNLDIG